MTQRLTFTSPIGGVGRSTIALHTAVAWGARGRRTLLIDLDPNNGLAHAIGRGDRSTRGVCDVLALDVAPSQVIVPTRNPNTSLLLRGRLDPLDASHFEALLSERGRLAAMLAHLEHDFDRIIVDAPSGTRAITRAALVESSHAAIVLGADSRSVRALSQTMRLIESVRAQDNAGLALSGIALSRVDLRRVSAQSAVGALWDGFECVFESTIAESDVVAKAADAGVPVTHWGVEGQPVARRFDALAQEIDATLHEPHRQGANAHDSQPRPFL